MSAALSLATEVRPARKPRAQRKPEVAPVRRPAPVRCELAYWCRGYVVGAAATSCYLNALAFGSAAPDSQRWAAWTLGALIPAGVLALGRVASLLWLRQARILSAVAAAVAGALLLLSLWHCTESVALLTGSPWPLALLMALAVDAGMATAETAATLAGRK